MYFNAGFRQDVIKWDFLWVIYCAYIAASFYRVSSYRVPPSHLDYVVLRILFDYGTRPMPISGETFQPLNGEMMFAPAPCMNWEASDSGGMFRDIP